MQCGVWGEIKYRSRLSVGRVVIGTGKWPPLQSQRGRRCGKDQLQLPTPLLRPSTHRRHTRHIPLIHEHLMWLCAISAHLVAPRDHDAFRHAHLHRAGMPVACRETQTGRLVLRLACHRDVLGYVHRPEIRDGISSQRIQITDLIITQEQITSKRHHEIVTVSQSTF